jgi:hypothetical protein
MSRILDNIEQKLLLTLRATLHVDEQIDFDQETLAILADKKLAKELLKRRKAALVEMEKGELMETKDLFRE